MGYIRHVIFKEIWNGYILSETSVVIWQNQSYTLTGTTAQFTHVWLEIWEHGNTECLEDIIIQANIWKYWLSLNDYFLC